MGLRPGRCYKNPKKGVKGTGARGHRKTRKQKRAFTRVAVRRPKRNYIGAAPALRIRQFNMGNPLRSYTIIADLCVKEAFDLRDNAIESARMAINRQLVKDLGKEGFFMKVRVYPSNIMRENKAAQGAGADRVSQGMSQSFGKPVGRSARVRNGQVIYSVLLNTGQKKLVKDCLMRAKSRFPSDVEVKFHDDIKSIGTLPAKKSRDPTALKKKQDDENAAIAEAKDGKPVAKAGAKDAKKPDAKADPKAKETKTTDKKGKK